MPRQPEGAGPAIITTHPFAPRSEWFTVCRQCGLAEAAHAESTLCQACAQPVDELGETLCADCDAEQRP